LLMRTSNASFFYKFSSAGEAPVSNILVLGALC
jgi:hypothetical protein